MNKIAIISRLTTTRGFILMDVLFATLVLSVALLPISGMFAQAIRADTLARDYTGAANLAQQQLELLKTQPVEYWQELSEPCLIPWQDTSQLPPAPYVVTTSAMDVPEKTVVQVRVNVTWQEGDKNCNLEFITLYPKL